MSDTEGMDEQPSLSMSVEIEMACGHMDEPQEGEPIRVPSLVKCRACRLADNIRDSEAWRAADCPPGLVTGFADRAHKENGPGPR